MIISIITFPTNITIITIITIIIILTMMMMIVIIFTNDITIITPTHHHLTIIINITAMQSVSSSFKGDTMGVLPCQLLIASKQSLPLLS